MSRFFVADTQRDGKRFVVRDDDKLTAFIELEAAVSASEFSVYEQATLLQTSAMKARRTISLDGEVAIL